MMRMNDLANSHSSFSEIYVIRESPPFNTGNAVMRMIVVLPTDYRILYIYTLKRFVQNFSKVSQVTMPRTDTAVAQNASGTTESAGVSPATNVAQDTVRPALIRLERLSKMYTEGERQHIVLDELDDQFYAGEFVCLLGKSGSGKSTLLNLISGIDAPSGGEIWIHAPHGPLSGPTGNPRVDSTADGVNGADVSRPVSITAMNERERTLFRRNHIGIIFQFFNLIPTLTVQENVMLPLELAGGDRAEAARAHALLDRVGLGDRLRTYPDKLSGGEQQRVAIARALSHDPLLILADEPTGNLDEDTGNTVLALLLELTRDAGKTLVMATHDTEVAARADRVVHLAHGKLVGDMPDAF